MTVPRSCRWLRLTALVPFGFGIFLSITYAHTSTALDETGRAALSLLHLGYIGNPYALPTGPTAHVSPVTTLMLAAVFDVFGDNSTTARIVLSLICSLLYSINCWLTIRICEQCTVRTLGILLAACMTTLVPVFMFEAVINYRYWDQPLAATILCVALYVLLDALQNDRPAYVPETSLALLAALGNLTSPAILPSIIGGLAILIYNRCNRRCELRAVLLGVAIVAGIILPWGVRNEIMLGNFIWARSNFGLELEIGNQDGATGSVTHHDPLHPFESKAAAQRLANIGEARYMAEMQQLAISWMRAHPIETLRLTFRRLWLLFFPIRDMWSSTPVLHGAAWYWFLAYDVLRLAAWARVLISGPRRGIWLLFAMLPLAPYAITHVELRYTYAVFFPSVCLIAVGLFSTTERRAASLVLMQ
jgi:hypothetical protein